MIILAFVCDVSVLSAGGLLGSLKDFSDELGDMPAQGVSLKRYDDALSTPFSCVDSDDILTSISERDASYQSFLEGEADPLPYSKGIVLDVQNTMALQKPYDKKIGEKKHNLPKNKSKSCSSNRLKVRLSGLSQSAHCKLSSGLFEAKLLKAFRAQLLKSRAPRTVRPMVKVRSRKVVMDDQPSLKGQTFLKGSRVVGKKGKLSKQIRKLAFSKRGGQKKSRAKRSAPSKREHKKKLEMGAYLRFKFMKLDFWFRFFWGM